MADNVKTNIFQEMVEDRDIDVTPQEEGSKGSKTDENTDTVKQVIEVDKQGFKHLLMFDYFSLNPNTTGDNDTELLRKIADHLESETKDGVERELMEMEYKIGKAPLGTSRLQHIYNYVRLLTSGRDAMEDIKKYERLGDK